MNATSLYVSTSRLVFQLESGDQSVNDLYRLIPYLRQALSCTVCDSLLVDPYTPRETQCQHHVCRLCVGGRKNLKPICVWCRDCRKYEVNGQLRILLQCYKSLCEYIISTPIYETMHTQTDASAMNGNGTAAPTSLADLIDEGAHFQDDYKSNSGLHRSAYSILPCIYTNNAATSSGGAASSSTLSIPISDPKESTTGKSIINVTSIQSPATVTAAAATTATVTVPSIPPPTNPAPIKTVSNGTALYSVMYAGSGNKITIKRKTESDDSESVPKTTIITNGGSFQSQTSIHTSNNNSNNNGGSCVRTEGTGPMSIAKSLAAQHQQQQLMTTAAAAAASGGQFKKPQTARSKTMQQKRKGCRCGNATPTPGKLTCCGQRCPCYVESKSCIDCNCRGCRNPHRADGLKVRPHIPQLDCIELLNTDGSTSQAKCVELPLHAFTTTTTTAAAAAAAATATTPTATINGQTIQTNNSNLIQSLSSQSQQIQQMHHLQHFSIDPSTHQQQQQQQHQHQQQHTHDLALDNGSIVFNPTVISDSDIQVVNVYTTHLPESYTLPAIFM